MQGQGRLREVLIRSRSERRRIGEADSSFGSSTATYGLKQYLRDDRLSEQLEIG